MLDSRSFQVTVFEQLLTIKLGNTEKLKTSLISHIHARSHIVFSGSTVKARQDSMRIIAN
jgi:hypothetical protein